MIRFKDIRWKNFLATGNEWTELSLDSFPTTLIVGHNGAGKSTLLDALSFVLFGKPHRKINKPQLTNTINNKDCLVEISFEIGAGSFRVVRGLKPAIFEIWKNGVMINQDSHAKEYQKVLEQNILKLTHKSFHQIVVLGSSSFIPFMQLSAQYRREVIEDLLDINVFSKMNTIMREKHLKLRERLKDVGHQIEVLDNRIVAQEKYVHDISDRNSEELGIKETEIQNINDKIAALEDKNILDLNQIEETTKLVSDSLNSAHNKKTDLLQSKADLNSSIKELVKAAQFYEKHEDCPTCHQTIDKDLRDKNLGESKSRAAGLNSQLQENNERSREVADEIDEFSKQAKSLRDRQLRINGRNSEVKALQGRIDDLNRDVHRLNSRESITSEAKAELDEYLMEREKLRKEKFRMSEEYTYNTVITEMLKDTGIKTKVIKQYVPIINNLVNQYLQTLDFFVSFDLDEEFKETIRSRHRDAFSYESFSEGEKQRIDLALLFTWRMIAKMKNSVSTNLLVLDETFDASLDYDGVDNLLKILQTLSDDSNVVIISHKGEVLDDAFSRKIEFKKEKNFSVMIA